MCVCMYCSVIAMQMLLCYMVTYFLLYKNIFVQFFSHSEEFVCLYCIISNFICSCMNCLEYVNY